jgi:hypothetical protein
MFLHMFQAIFLPSPLGFFLLMGDSLSLSFLLFLSDNLKKDPLFYRCLFPLLLL